MLLCIIVPVKANVEVHARIWVAGHMGLVGSAIVREYQAQGYDNLILRTHKELDLTDAAAVKAFYAQEKPEYVVVAAARVGGIGANSTYPANFIYENLAIELNVINGAREACVKKLLFLGSSCIYPRACPQPMKEEYLLTSPLEPTNEWYALAKIAGLKLCQAYSKQYGLNFISLMPTNLYGSRDNFDLYNSHVLPALIRKFVDAQEQGNPEVILWGTGKVRREFLFVDDLAKAVVWAMNEYQENQWLNVGTGEDCTIDEIARMIADIIGYKGTIVYDIQKPDGPERKLLDVTKIHAYGWYAQTSLREGLEKTIAWYREHRQNVRGHDEQ